MLPELMVNCSPVVLEQISFPCGKLNPLTPCTRSRTPKTITGRQVRGSGIVGYVLDVSWGSDGKHFFASGRDGGILVFGAKLFKAESTANWLSLAKEQVQRRLSLDECKQYFLDINCEFDQ